ncbi:MAG: nucleoside hydrolase [Clostridiales bacterium]|nr:nucleoside hydrolase [Clostridiales bacterium]
MTYNRLIMFCDYGLDDAIATLHILKNAHMFNRIDIVPIGGNVSAQTAFRNAHTLLYHAGADKNKVRIVDTRAIEQCAADIPDIHGADGIGDILEPAQSDIPVIDFKAYKAEIQDSALPARDCVLSVGPCTVPDMLGYVPFCTVLMGGTVDEPPNYGDYEFNEGCDVAAFKSFAYGATAVATLDTCHDKGFGFETFTMNDTLADRLIDKYRDMCNSRNAVVSVYDYVAALAVTNPEKFDVTRIRRKDGVEFNQLRIKNA